MRQRLSIGFAALLVLLISVGARAAAPREPVLIVDGAGGGYADFTLNASTSFSIDPYGERVSIGGGTDFAGFCLVPFTASARLKGLNVAPCMVRLKTAPGIILDTIGATPSSLAAGRYRIYVFADAPTRFIIPLQGLTRSLRLSLRGPAPRAHLSATYAGLGPEVERSRQTTIFSPTGATWVGWHFLGLSPVVANGSDLCVVPSPGECLAGINTAHNGYSFTGPNIYRAGGTTISTSSGPDGNPALRGAVDVYLTNVSTDVDTSSVAFTFRVAYGSAAGDF